MLGDKGLVAGQHFVRQHGKRILVGHATHRLALDLFGRHIVGRPDDQTGLRELIGRGDLGDAEVGDLGHSGFVDDDVGGLDIAMDDSPMVRVIERGGGLAEEAEEAGRL